MAGAWSGSGTITLDDGSNERIRCRATYAVGGAGKRSQPEPDLRQRQLQDQSVPAMSSRRASALAGTWSEATRNVSGNLEGRGGGGTFQVVASAPGILGAYFAEDAG